MLYLLLSWLGGAVHAYESNPTLPVVKLCPPNCLAIKDVDTERRPDDLTREWDRALAASGGLHSLLISVDQSSDVEVVVNGATLGEENLVDKVDERGVIVFFHRIPIGPDDGVYVEITNVGETETGYDILIEATSEPVR